jgi:thiamine phosphate synthase YjbQ (UPF0047 family)
MKITVLGHAFCSTNAICSLVRIRSWSHSVGLMKTHTRYLTFTTQSRQEIIDITDEVERTRAEAHLRDGMILVSAMHISASVFVNDHEPGLGNDILHWLEERIAPWDPDR